jgi:hypothetical protein
MDNKWILLVSQMDAIEHSEEFRILLQNEAQFGNKERTALRQLVQTALLHVLKEKVCIDEEVEKILKDSKAYSTLAEEHRELVTLWFLRFIQKGFDKLDEVMTDLVGFEDYEVDKVAVGYNPDLAYVKVRNKNKPVALVLQ